MNEEHNRVHEPARQDQKNCDTECQTSCQARHAEPTSSPSTNSQYANSEGASELEECKTEAAEWKDKFFHVSADFQNYKKRIEKERASLNYVIKSGILLELLAIADNFDRALEGAEGVEKTNVAEQWLEGFALIRKDLHKFLEKQDVKEIEVHETFDPEMHDAVLQVAADDKQPGTIVEVLQKGYMFGDLVLRPAKVSVAQ